jgi:hypothetical protein
MHAAHDFRLERAAPASGAGDAAFIVQVIYRLDVRGLENGAVNLAHRMPADRYRHAIICLKHFTQFRHRIACADVPACHAGRRGRSQPHSTLPTFNSCIGNGTGAMAGAQAHVPVGRSQGERC